MLIPYKILIQHNIIEGWWCDFYFFWEIYIFYRVRRASGNRHFLPAEKFEESGFGTAIYCPCGLFEATNVSDLWLGAEGLTIFASGLTFAPLVRPGFFAGP